MASRGACDARGVMDLRPCVESGGRYVEREDALEVAWSKHWESDEKWLWFSHVFTPNRAETASQDLTDPLDNAL